MTFITIVYTFHFFLQHCYYFFKLCFFFADISARFPVPAYCHRFRPHPKVARHWIEMRLLKNVSFKLISFRFFVVCLVGKSPLFSLVWQRNGCFFAPHSSTYFILYSFCAKYEIRLFFGANPVFTLPVLHATSLHIYKESVKWLLTVQCLKQEFFHIYYLLY